MAVAEVMVAHDLSWLQTSYVNSPGFYEIVTVYLCLSDHQI